MRTLSMVLFLVLVLVTHGLADGPPPARVVLGEVTSDTVATTRSVTGVLYYDRVSEVSTEVPGLVDRVEVSLGDRVDEGAPLVRLNTEILDREIALTRTRIDQASLRIDQALKNFNRLENLYSKEGVSEKDYDDAHFALEDARKDKQATEDSLAKLQIQKQRSVIRAPFAGIVLKKEVDAGAWVQQGRQLVLLGATDRLYVRAPIAENLLQFVDVGSEVEVVINAFSRRLTGVIRGIDPVADLKTKNVFLRISVPPMDLVAENMSAQVFVPGSEASQLNVLPRAALVKYQGKDFVYTVKDGKAAILPVSVAAYLGDRVAVESPAITSGMMVVVEGNERLRPDQPVLTSGGN